MKVFVFDTSSLQRLLLLPDRLQGRALRQRLDAIRQATARDRSVLAEAERVRDGAPSPRSRSTTSRPCATTATSLPASTRATDRWRHLQAGRWPGHHRPGSLHAAAPTASPPVPIDAIYMNDALQIAQKCTGCAHLLDAGWTEPRCVDACPTGASEVPGGSGRGRAGWSTPRYCGQKTAWCPESTTATFPRSSSPARSTTRSRKR